MRTKKINTEQDAFVKKVKDLKINDEKKEELIKIILTVFEMIKENGDGF